MALLLTQRQVELPFVVQRVVEQLPFYLVVAL
jgi:hypothetical protein